MAAAGRRNAAAASWLLTSLVLAAAIPLVLFGGWVAFLTADSGRTGARNAALETSVRVAERVSAEIAKEIEVGEALAASAALDGANLATFYAEAQRLAATRPLWETVWLSDTGGMQVLNVLRPLGSTLALDADPETLREAVRLREPLVGGIGPLGPISGKRLVALRVPVIRDGSLLYVLSIGLNPAAISTILANAGAPEGWIGAIVDANGNIIARTIAEEREAGQAASVSTRAAIAAAPQGFYTGRTLEGVEVETVYRALPGTAGWTVHFGIPRETLNAPVTRSVILLVVGGLVSLALAAALAALIARDLAQRRRIEEERASLALKLSEERGAVAVDAADLGTWRWDVSGSRVLGSQRTRTLLDLPLKMGTGDDAQWTTAEFLAAVHPSDRRGLEEALARCLSKGHILDVEFRVAWSGGGTRWVRATGRMTEGDPPRSTASSSTSTRKSVPRPSAATSCAASPRRRRTSSAASPASCTTRSARP
jgi:PAS domain-containing protein